ncbi:MAG TPA: amidohydrolase family protein [Thermodesulfobacteriota bacterium]|nr:amidohydrolase family protein [Thermodesulfobacteriota bacterium]
MDPKLVSGDGRKPRLICPPKACETHSHIYGPPDKYPRSPGRRPDTSAPIEEYEKMLKRLGFERCVIVQPSLYSTDNRCTLDAIRHFGLSRARGVAVTKKDVTAAELQHLHDAGIRGLRFYLLVDDFRIADAPEMARRIAPLGWHLQIQDRGNWLADAVPMMMKLPVDVVIDHVGRTPPENGVSDPGFKALLRFMETGRCWVKISAPYLASSDGAPHYRDVGEKVRALVSVRPDRLVWAANWPHPSHDPARKPEEADYLDTLLAWVPDAAVRKAILADNPGKLYDFSD